jgi:outer membrane protein
LIGTVDIQEAILKHPKAEESLNTLREFQAERQKDLDAKTKGKELTDEEKKQISELISKYEEEIENKDKELTAKLFEEIKLAIEKVAKRRGLILVVEKQSVFYGGIDITEEVIAELNKK